MNTLTYLHEFEQVLRDYRISSESKKILSQTKLALMVSPSSVGRNTLIRELLKTGHYHFIISDTTRSPRINDGVLERNGVEYWFRGENDILADLRAGKFLEAAIIHNQQVSGISLREIEQAKHEGRVAITDIEIVGADTIISVKPDTLAFFVLPPSFEEWQRRIKTRGHMNDEEYRRRMKSAGVEYKHAIEKDQYIFVVNDKLSKAVDYIQQIVKDGLIDDTFQSQGRHLAQQLYTQTKAWLDQDNSKTL